jgi:putative ABC transport system ATP-binding protein
MTKDAVLVLKNVSREYIQAGQKFTALQQVDFSIHPGEFIAIIGPSGSGKSTFLTIAGGLQNPSSGSVIIGGTNITKLSVKELSRVRLSEVGFILQASNVSRRKENVNVMADLFSVLSIEKLRKKYPTDLSGGERQRVAIAKVLYGTSSLILADEPTASLDTKKAFEVVELLAKETHERGKATIMVTHDERLLKYCDAVYEMQDGRLTRRRMS